jgi:hypothetical protein
VGGARQVGLCPDRKEARPPASSSQMTKTAFDNDAARGGSGDAVTPDGLLFLAILAFGLAILALLGVLALADVIGVARILPFLALPPALFIASGVLFWRGAPGEREEVGVRQVARSPSAGSSI